MGRPTRRGKSSQSGKASAGFSQLPDELILKIFKFLPKKAVKSCALVCRRWQRIAYDTRLGLWTAFAITEIAMKKALPMEILGIALSNGLRKLYIHKSQILPAIMPTHIPADSLQSLTLWFTEISSPCLARIILRNLSLESVRLAELSCLDDVVCRAIGRLPKLKSLYLQSSQLSYDMIVSLTPALERADDVQLRGTPLTSRDLDAVTNNLNPELETLSLSCGSGSLQDIHVWRILSCCPNLKYLMLWNGMCLSPLAKRALRSSHITHVHVNLAEKFEEHETAVSLTQPDARRSQRTHHDSSQVTANDFFRLEI